MKIKAVYDNPEFNDRYSVYFGPKNKVNGLTDCLGLSDNPTHPQGFSQFCMGEPGPHNGQKINFSDLPAKIRAHVRERLSDGRI